MNEIRPVRLGPRPEPPPAMVVLGVIAAGDDLRREVGELFMARFGGVESWGPADEFQHTRYYEREMGLGLKRAFCLGKRLVPATELVALKEWAWELEQRYLQDGLRRVNLDPGLLDHTKVVLGSYKEGPQKLYLGSGVWADTVLYLAYKTLGPLPWTFPDLKEGAHLEFLTQARTDYKRLLRQERAAGPQE